MADGIDLKDEKDKGGLFPRIRFDFKIVDFSKPIPSIRFNFPWVRWGKSEDTPPSTKKKK